MSKEGLIEENNIEEITNEVAQKEEVVKVAKKTSKFIQKIKQIGNKIETNFSKNLDPVLSSNLVANSKDYYQTLLEKSKNNANTGVVQQITMEDIKNKKRSS